MPAIHHPHLIICLAGVVTLFDRLGRTGLEHFDLGGFAIRLRPPLLEFRLVLHQLLCTTGTGEQLLDYLAATKAAGQLTLHSAH